MTSAPTRPVLRYHGGKWMLAPWILSHFPRHRVYVEPFGGAGSVLLRKPRSWAEVWNDLDGEVVAVFRVLRDPDLAERLRRALQLTPYARREFFDSYEDAPDEGDLVEIARRRIVRAGMAFGTTSGNRGRTGFRATPWRAGGNHGANDWATYPEAVGAFVERLRGVLIESRPALEIIRQQDAPEVLHYCDPPYVEATRSAIRHPCDRDRGYRHNMTDDDHRELAEVLHAARGMVVLSGYACDLYDVELYAGWQRIERETLADGAKRRTEVLWLNPAATAGASSPPLLRGLS